MCACELVIKKKKRKIAILYRGFAKQERRRLADDTRLHVCRRRSKSPRHSFSFSARGKQKQTNKHPPHRHRSPLTSNSFFLCSSFTYLFLDERTQCSRGPLTTLPASFCFCFVLFYKIFRTFEDPPLPPEPTTHQEVICFRDYCTCVGKLGDGGGGRAGWGGGLMLRNATVNSCVRSIKMYLMVQTLRHIANY